jgi:hypothetical protein
MGITNPGNNSEDSIFKGSVNEMGMTIKAKERMDSAKLKTNSALFFIHFIV